MKKKFNLRLRDVSLVSLLMLLLLSFNACSSADPTETYVKAVNDNDFAKAHEILMDLQTEYIKASQRSGFRDTEDEARDFWNAANYIYKAEMQYLLPQNDPEADRRLLYTLDDFTPIGVSPEADHVYSLSEHNHYWQDFNEYMGYADGYNKLCIEMIRVALRNNNPDFAKDVFASMKDNFHKDMDKDGENTYTYTLNDQARKEAEKLIQDYENRH